VRSSPREGSRAPRRCGESSPDIALPTQATFASDFVTTSKRRYTLPCEACASPVFSPARGIPGDTRQIRWTTTPHSYARVCINTRERSIARSRI
jgi:hypothetical protein